MESRAETRQPRLHQFEEQRHVVGADTLDVAEVAIVEPRQRAVVVHAGEQGFGPGLQSAVLGVKRPDIGDLGRQLAGDAEVGIEVHRHIEMGAVDGRQFRAAPGDAGEQVDFAGRGNLGESEGHLRLKLTQGGEFRRARQRFHGHAGQAVVVAALDAVGMLHQQLARLAQRCRVADVGGSGQRRRARGEVHLAAAHQVEQFGRIARRYDAQLDAEFVGEGLGQVELDAPGVLRAARLLIEHGVRAHAHQQLAALVGRF